MIVITHFADEGPDFQATARVALDALSRCAGYQRGTIGRCTDDTEAWVLLTEWENVGSYRRALGSYDVKINTAPLLALAIDLPSGFESLVDIAPGGETDTHASDRAPSA